MAARTAGVKACSTVLRSACRSLHSSHPSVVRCSAAGQGTDDALPLSQHRPPRFYVPTTLASASSGSILRLSAEEARHATKTLRLRQGDRVELADGRGWLVVAELSDADRAGAVAHAVEAPRQVALTGWQWDVACACGSLKGGRSDWLVEKCAELGAAALTPLLTHRSPTIGSGGSEDERPAAGSGKRAGRRKSGDDEAEDAAGSGSGREGRWVRVATAAMKQCLRPHALALGSPATVPQLCERIRAADAALVGVAGAPPLHAVAAELQARPSRPLHGILCIGPEGDFTSEELQELLAAGARPVALGDLRLRAETAAIALLSYLRMHLD